MSEILDNIYIDRFLLLAFVKYILSQIYSHYIRNCSFWYLWKLLLFEENIFKVFLYLCFFIQKPVTSMTQECLVVENCPTPEVHCYNNAKRSFLKIQGQCMKFSKTGRNCNPLFKLVNSNWVMIIEQKKKDGVQLNMYFSSQLGFQRV